MSFLLISGTKPRRSAKAEQRCFATLRYAMLCVDIFRWPQKISKSPEGFLMCSALPRAIGLSTLPRPPLASAGPGRAQIIDAP